MTLTLNSKGGRPTVLRKCLCGKEFPTAQFRKHIVDCLQIEIEGKVYDKLLPVLVHPKKRKDAEIIYTPIGSTPSKTVRAALGYEVLTPGDVAWVSWDGHSAWPCVVKEANFPENISRPAVPPGYLVESIGLNPKWKAGPSKFRWQVGNANWLFLDEVSTTPERACRSFVSL